MDNAYLGTIGWSYSFWREVFYPPKTSIKNFLPYYAKQFKTVEVDSTFYRIPTTQTLTNWVNQVPEDFVFSLKFPQLITHIKRLVDSQKETELFLSRAKLLGKKLGPLLLQFAPSFSIEAYSALESYIENLPKSNRYVVEVRNKSWRNRKF